jgi:hypothetical protein
MYDDYNYILNPDCCVFNDPFVRCEQCGAVCKEFDLENGVCAYCVAESEAEDECFA